MSIWQELVLLLMMWVVFLWDWDDAEVLMHSLSGKILPAAATAAPVDDDPTTTSSTSLNRSQTQSIASIHISTSETVDAFSVATTCFRDDADANIADVGDDGHNNSNSFGLVEERILFLVHTSNDRASTSLMYFIFFLLAREDDEDDDGDDDDFLEQDGGGGGGECV